jgi:threonine dehydrogenase-like Zn-dependent dehydrogenase
VALQTIPYPSDPGPGQALVRTTLSMICGSDIHIVDELEAIPAGTPMGHEAIGVVEAVGDGVSAFKAGDRVAVSCLLSCGECAACKRGEGQVCETLAAPGNLLFGAQGEYFLVNGAQHSMARVSDGLEDEQVLFVTDIMSTGFGAIERANIQQRDTVAIFAQGPVGLCATAAARTLGAGTVVAVESIPERAAMARKMGAEVVFEPGEAVAKIMEMTNNRGVDIAVEALGLQATFESGCAVTRFGGTVSSVGVYASFPELKLPTSGTFLHRQLVTTLCPSGTARLESLMALIAGGKVDLRPLLSHSMKLSETVEAYDLFRRREGGVLKIGLRP